MNHTNQEIDSNRKCSDCKILSTCNNERWKKSFDIIKLENELISHRMTSLLTTTAFLFTGLYFIFGAIKDAKSTNGLNSMSLYALYYLICSIGILSSYVTIKGTRAASRQIKASAHWLYYIDKQESQCKTQRPYPPIIGLETRLLRSFCDIIPFIRIDMFNKNTKFYKYFLDEPCYDDDYHLDEKDIDNIQSMSAGIIYLPNILFCVWFVLCPLPFLASSPTPQGAFPPVDIHASITSLEGDEIQVNIRLSDKHQADLLNIYKTKESSDLKATNKPRVESTIPDDYSYRD